MNQKFVPQTANQVLFFIIMVVIPYSGNFICHCRQKGNTSH